MKRRGFTLIELLAVIIVLAIVALIATPIVMRSIEKSRKESAEVSMKNIEKTAELYFYNQKITGAFTEVVFKCSNGVCESGDKRLEISGKGPESGTITINQKGEIILDAIVIDGYFCVKQGDEYSCQKTELKELSTTNGVITFNDGLAGSLSNYKLYGNSVQNGTPTPETPIEIESVGDKTKNILPMNGNHTKTINDLNLVLENDIITLNGTINVNSQFGFYLDNDKLNSVVGVVGLERNTPNLMSLKAGTYTMTLKYLSGAFETEGNNTPYFGLYTYKNGSTLIDTRSYIGMSDKTYKFTLNQDVDAQFFVLQFTAKNYPITFNNYKFKVQIEEGSIATDYEPYGYKIPIKVSGKNLFDMNEYRGNYFYCTSNSTTNKITVTAENTNDPHVRPTNLSSKNKNDYYLIDAEANTQYSLSWDTSWSSSLTSKLSNANKVIVYFYDENFTRISDVKIYTNQVNHSNQTFTTPANTKYIFVRFGYELTEPVVSAEVEYSKVILSKSSVEESYESYVEPITTNIYLNEPLRKVGDYADYIDFEKGQVIRNIYRKTLVGTEVFYYGARAIVSNLSNVGLVNNDVVLCNSSHYSSSGWGNLWSKGYTTSSTGTQGIALNGTYIRIVDMINFPNVDSDATQANKFKTYVAEQYANGTPLIIDYVLATPSPEPIDLPDIRLFEGYNNISIETKIRPSEFSLFYYNKQ